MNLYLTDEEAAALLRELDNIIDGDRYFLSKRIKTLRAICAKIRPEPVREPLPPPPKRYALPRASAAKRRRAGAEIDRIVRPAEKPRRQRRSGSEAAQGDDRPQIRSKNG